MSFEHGLQKDAHSRVTQTLLNLAAERSVPDADGLLIPLLVTQTDLADMAGLSRETVNIVLGKLRSRGLVETTRDTRKYTCAFNGSAPSRFALSSVDVWVEVRGARGEFQIERLEPGEFMFRRSVLEGRALGDSAGNALDLDPAFDAGRAFTALVRDGLVAAIATGVMGGTR